MTTIEAQRSALEELDRIEQAIADRVAYNPGILPDGVTLGASSVLHGRKKRTLRETMTTQHEVAKLLDRYQSQCKMLKTTQTDEQVGGMGDFDRQVQQKRDFHRRYPNEQVEDQEALYKKRGMASAFASDLNVDQKFSAEEQFGRFVDMLQLRDEFVNLAMNKNTRLSYLQYLTWFANFDDAELFPPARLRDDEYIKYVEHLQQYLEEFLYKTRPLSQPAKTLAGIKSSFEPPSTPKTNGLYCGPCGKEFGNENVFNSHLNGKKHKKNEQAFQNADHSPVLLHEHMVKGLAEYLTKVVANTRDNVERRQALTDRERQDEIAQLEHDIYGDGREPSEDEGNNPDQDKDEEDEEHGTDFNPLKLPLGDDGKPIPYWLWKLNGLDQEYTCEICGNYTFYGRRAYENHFMEDRHINGLRCLDIRDAQDNAVVYKDITSIAQVKQLADRRKQEQRRKEKEYNNTREVEDEEGNPMSEATYEELRRQGVL